jgi:DNA repair protein RadD
MVECPQVAALVDQGHLVKTRVYAPVDPDLRGVRTVAGDYVENQLADRMDTPKLVGDIVTHWHKYGEQRRTVVFAVGVGHSIHIRDEFINSGVRAEHLDGSTPMTERDAILARLATGETEVVTNCMVLTEGWDMPEIGCCILARPTKKMGLFRQMIGRVLRPSEGKPDAIVLDHSGAVYRHGLPEDHVEWTLSPDKKAESPTHQSRLRRDAPGLLECTQCAALRTGGQPCPCCGFLPKRPAQYVAHVDGDLSLVTGGKANGVNYDHQARQAWHAQLRAIAQLRGYKPGWVAHKYREKFGTFPSWGSTPEPIAPPVLPHRTPRPTAQDIRKPPGAGSVCPTTQDIDAAARCPTAQDISRFASPERRERAQGSLTVRAPAQAGGAGSSPAPVATPRLRRLYALSSDPRAMLEVSLCGPQGRYNIMEEKLQ